MYEVFTEFLTFAEKVGDITDVGFQAEHGKYSTKGAIISGVTSSGEGFSIELRYERKVDPDAS